MTFYEHHGDNMPVVGYLLCELCVPLAKLPVLAGESLGSRLQFADVELQLSGVVPGDLQPPARLLSMGARTLSVRERGGLGLWRGTMTGSKQTFYYLEG